MPATKHGPTPVSRMSPASAPIAAAVVADRAISMGAPLSACHGAGCSPETKVMCVIQVRSIARRMARNAYGKSGFDPAIPTVRMSQVGSPTPSRSGRGSSDGMRVIAWSVGPSSASAVASSPRPGSPICPSPRRFSCSSGAAASWCRSSAVATAENARGATATANTVSITSTATSRDAPQPERRWSPTRRLVLMMALIDRPALAEQSTPVCAPAD